MSLGVKEGRFTATVSDPVWVRFRTEGIASLSSLTASDDFLAYALDEMLFAVSPDGEADLLEVMDSHVAEVRAWQFEGQRRPTIAVCLPQEDRVLTGVVIRPARWEQALTQGQLGPHLSDGSGLFYPLSAAGSPDGRSYVLDAGHGRIVAIDADGNYITQWGTRGNGAGQFDFGDGTKSQTGLNYGGSIAVDDDGFIYVADVGNGRIQKFAP